MPPKKKEEEKKILLGRPGNSLKSGIVCRTPSILNLHMAFSVLILGSLGRTCQCGKIDPVPGHYEVLVREPRRMFILSG
jgi:hypothetical protein